MSVFVTANGKNFEVTVKEVKASEILTGEGQGSATPRPASSSRRNNGSNPTEASGSEPNESGPGSEPNESGSGSENGSPESNQNGRPIGGRRRNKRKGTRRNKRKGTRRNKRN
jgi:hypothetical protein